ncbi:MAG: hypothetical protein JWR12_3002 [Mucilaginibacter sp.]|nr:hypothetical protein [Mucilaginibacter sp.]
MLSTLWLHSAFGQSEPDAKQVEWNYIQQLANTAFKQKAKEKYLSGAALKQQVGDRTYAFRRAYFALSPWIEKYYPDGFNHPTTGFVQATFIQALYLEYSGDYLRAYQAYSASLPYLLMALHQSHQAIPLYNQVSIDDWVQEKAEYYAAAGNDLKMHRDEFEIHLGYSVEDAVQSAAAQVKYLLSNRSFSGVVSNYADSIFIIKHTTIHFADSTAKNDPSPWAFVYFKGISGDLKLSLKRDSTKTFELYSISEQDDIRQQINTSMNQLTVEIQGRYIKERPLIPIIMVTHGGAGNPPLTDTLFHQYFGEGTQVYPMQLIRDKWNYRILLFNLPVQPATDSIRRLIDQQLVYGWLLNDFGPKTMPRCFSGIVFLYSDAKAGHGDHLELYFLKSVAQQNKLPTIETFIPEGDNGDDPKDIFERGYWSYFWWFLEKKGISSDFYNKVQAGTSGITDEQLAKMLGESSHETLEQLNQDFKNFILSRNEKNIPVGERHWESVARDFIY